MQYLGAAGLTRPIAEQFKIGGGFTTERSVGGEGDLHISKTPLTSYLTYIIPPYPRLILQKNLAPLQHHNFAPLALNPINSQAPAPL